MRITLETPSYGRGWGWGGLGAGCSKWRSFLDGWKKITLQGTNISPKNGILKMIFLFPRWDMLILWRVFTKNHDKTSSKSKTWTREKKTKTTSQGSFKSLGCAGIPCCPWKISKHTSTLVVVGYWAFNLWMAWSALDASGLMVVFTCFHMIISGGWSFFYPKKCMICFFPNRIEEDQTQSLPWWGCSCYKGVHVHMWVDVSV